MTATATLIEIFSSRQGEGIHVGEPMTFVRFGGCSLGCRFCDTPQARNASALCRAESPPRSAQFVAIDNPISTTGLDAILRTFDDPWIAVTGGEPLEQIDFLIAWLSTRADVRRILLETNGMDHEALAQVLPGIATVSMDIKLPSVAGIAPRWEDQRTFLARAHASGKELYIKVVVANSATDGEIERAIALVAERDPAIPFVLQPATPIEQSGASIDPARVESFAKRASTSLNDVRVIPQMHRRWKIL